METKQTEFINIVTAIAKGQPVMSTTVSQSLCNATKNDAWQYSLTHNCTPEEIEIISAIMAGGERIQKITKEKENGKGNELSHYVVNGKRVEKDAFKYTEAVKVSIEDGKKAEDFQKFIMEFTIIAQGYVAELEEKIQTLEAASLKK